LANLFNTNKTVDIKQLADSDEFQDLSKNLSLTEIMTVCDKFLLDEDFDNIPTGHDRETISCEYDKWKAIYDATYQYIGDDFTLGEDFRKKQAIFIVSNVALRRCLQSTHKMSKALAGDILFQEYLMIANMIMQRIFALDEKERTFENLIIRITEIGNLFFLICGI
jgi:hypothetical protein